MTEPWYGKHAPPFDEMGPVVLRVVCGHCGNRELLIGRNYLDGTVVLHREGRKNQGPVNRPSYAVPRLSERYSQVVFSVDTWVGRHRWVKCRKHGIMPMEPETLRTALDSRQGDRPATIRVREPRVSRWPSPA